MALKDLIAKKSELTEDAIESIVRDYIRYDIEEREVAFLPAATGLNGKQKVLVYLVALQGWPIVAEGEEIATSAKPAQIEERVGITGGTLRPLLKDLKDRHLIAWKEGAYSVRAAGLGDIKDELEGKRTTSRKPGKRQKDGEELLASPRHETKSRKRSVNRPNSLADKFGNWIDEGWFDDGRTLSDTRDRFHREGDIVPRTTLPSYFLSAVRAKRLERDKEEVNGKIIWVYRTRK